MKSLVVNTHFTITFSWQRARTETTCKICELTQSMKFVCRLRAKHTFTITFFPCENRNDGRVCGPPSQSMKPGAIDNFPNHFFQPLREQKRRKSLWSPCQSMKEAVQLNTLPNHFAFFVSCRFHRAHGRVSPFPLSIAWTAAPHPVFACLVPFLGGVFY